MTIARIVPDWALSQAYRRDNAPAGRPVVWATAGDTAPCLVTFAEDRLMIARRTRAGLCRITVAPSTYEGTTLHEAGGRFSVVLTHRDPGLALRFPASENRNEAEAIRDALQRTLERMAGKTSADVSGKVPAAA